MVANLMNCWVKKRVTVEQLLGIDEKGRKRTKPVRAFESASPDEQKKMLAEVERKLRQRNGKQATPAT